MKKSILLFVCMFSMLFAAGCGPSLKQYVGMSNSYATRTTAVNTVTVNIETDGGLSPVHRGGVFGAISTAVNVATAVGAAVVNKEQQPRLQKIVDGQKLAGLVNSGFEEGFTGMTHLTIAPEGRNPDLRIILKLNKYGLWAEDLLSPMNFFVEANIQIIHTQSMETIYSNGVTIMQEVSSMIADIASYTTAEVTDVTPRTRKARNTLQAIDDAGRLVSGAASLTAFFELSDQEIATLFDYMAYDAGVEVANRLNYHIYR